MEAYTQWLNGKIMAPNRFRRDVREKRESTPFAEDQSTTVFHTSDPPAIPPEWRDIEAPINFTWVCQDELCGMGWPKSRDQVRFLIDQGIDHLVTLSSDKLPPHYAFPDLKWTMIPVEDFTGPTISEIKKFISIMDDARKDGEAVGVHCAEGRGRTGVMCACYLIYYHDISPWDAIRIMRRQRPGSVERKVQEETVVTFGRLLSDYGKSTLEQLEQKEKELKELQKKQQEHSENLLLLHTASFYAPSGISAKKNERQERMQRSRSMPKINQEEEILAETVKEEINFRKHMQNFFQSNAGRCQSQPRDRRKKKAIKNEENEESEEEIQLRSRAVTPSRQLIMNLKPVAQSRPKNAKAHIEKQNKSDLNAPKNEYNQHFKSFMSTTSSVKRVRSFSQTRDKDGDENCKSVKTSDNKDSRKDSNTLPTTSVKVNRKIPNRNPSFETKYKEDRDEKENESKELQEDKSNNNNHAKQGRASSPTASECSMTSSLSSMSKEYSGANDKPILEQDNKEVERSAVRRTSSANSKDLPPPPASKPKCSMDSSSQSNYSYYVRIRSRASSKHDGAEESKAANDETQNEEEKKDPTKEESVKRNSSTPKSKPRMRSRATTRRSDLSPNSNDKDSVSKPKTKSASQSEGTATSKVERKKSRSKAIGKDMELNNAETEENTIKSVNENKSDYKTNVTDSVTKPKDIVKVYDMVKKEIKEPEKPISTPPKSSPPKINYSSDPYWKMIYGDEVDSVASHDNKGSKDSQESNSDKVGKTMAAARSTLLQPKPMARRRSSNSSNKECNLEVGGSDSNNNDTTPRPSPCKYAGSLSNSSIQSSPNLSVTSAVTCSSNTTTQENENNVKGNRKRTNRIYDRSDSNSSYKSNGHRPTQGTGNEVENRSNDKLNNERKRSLSKGVDESKSSNYLTDKTIITAINSPAITATSVEDINKINHKITTNNANQSLPDNHITSHVSSSNSNSTASSYVTEKERRQRNPYRRSRTGPIADLNLVDSNDNDKSSEEKKDRENNAQSNSYSLPSSRVGSSTTNDNNEKFEATKTAPTTPKSHSKMNGTNLHYSSHRMSYSVRAKSECNLTDYDNVINDNEQYRSTDDNSRNNASVTSSSTGNTYGLSNISTGRDNQFLNAAKRWASYDKTPYISPFARDSWKRTHRKFNYSRFLNYTRETFV